MHSTKQYIYYDGASLCKEIKTERGILICICWWGFLQSSLYWGMYTSIPRYDVVYGVYA